MRKYSLLCFSLALGSASFLFHSQPRPLIVILAAGSVILSAIATYAFPIRLTGLAGIAGLSVAMNLIQASQPPAQLLIAFSLLGIVLGVWFEFIDYLVQSSQGENNEYYFPG